MIAGCYVGIGNSCLKDTISYIPGYTYANDKWGYVLKYAVSKIEQVLFISTIYLTLKNDMEMGFSLYTKTIWETWNWWITTAFPSVWPPFNWKCPSLVNLCWRILIFCEIPCVVIGIYLDSYIFGDIWDNHFRYTMHSMHQY